MDRPRPFPKRTQMACARICADCGRQREKISFFRYFQAFKQLNAGCVMRFKSTRSFCFLERCSAGAYLARIQSIIITVRHDGSDRDIAILLGTFTEL